MINHLYSRWRYKENTARRTAARLAQEKQQGGVLFSTAALHIWI
jgi:hypothetical protein